MDNTVPLMVCYENEITPILPMKGPSSESLTASKQLRLGLNTGQGSGHCHVCSFGVIFLATEMGFADKT